MSTLKMGSENRKGANQNLFYDSTQSDHGQIDNMRRKLLSDGVIQYHNSSAMRVVSGAARTKLSPATATTSTSQVQTATSTAKNDKRGSEMVE